MKWGYWIQRLIQGGILLIFVMALGFQVQPGLGQEETDPPYYVEQVADIAEGSASSNPSWFLEVNGKVYFQAQDGDHGFELWRYNPYTVETTMVADIYEGWQSSNPEWLVSDGDWIFFAATDGEHGRQIWKHNTINGTTRIAVDQSTSADPKWLTFVGPVLYYSADVQASDPGDYLGRELYSYDTAKGKVELVKDINSGSASSEPEYLYQQGDLLFFTADDGEHGEEFWRTDGTRKGTNMVKDIWPGGNGSEPSSFNVLEYQFIFSADDGKHGRELWSSFGTGGTTTMIRDIHEGGKDSDPGWANRLGDSMVFFPAESEEFGNELWRYDKKYGAYLLADIREGKKDSDPAAIGDVGWVMFFSADDRMSGVELWKTEPPYTYANQVADINPGWQDSDPKLLDRFGTTLFFTADDGQHGEELWFSEPPYTNVYLLKDIREGPQGSIPEVEVEEFSSTKSNTLKVGWTIYFTANDGETGVELWQVSTGALPPTGFPPGKETTVNVSPSALGYQQMGEMRLEIPKLEKSFSVVGIPKQGNTWNVKGLGPNDVGYMMGTAFPTWQGNTAISGHVYDADGRPGPFAQLGELSWGDRVIVHAWGQDYIYEIRERDTRVDPNDKTILSHKEYDWLTLITCKGYNEETEYYRWRSVVQAVLVKIEDHSWGKHFRAP